MAEPVLALRGISKSFGAIRALSDVDLALEPGEVLGLMGDNGAGKSTLVRIVAGNFSPTSGEMRLNGEPVHFHRPLDARRNGIEIVYQDLALCDNLTAAANVFLGREVRRRFGPFRMLDYRAMYSRSGALFAELKSETRPRIWCAACRADSVRRWRSHARGSPMRASYCWTNRPRRSRCVRWPRCWT